MTDFTNILSILGVGGYVVGGIFALRGMWDTSAKQKQSEERTLSDGLITRLQQTVEQQAKDLDKMRDDMAKHTAARDAEVKELRDALKHMQGRNAVLEDLFKGRDPAMQAFLKDAPTLMEIAHENNGLARESAQGLQNLEKTLTRFVDALQPILIHAEMMKPPKTEVQ